MPQGTDLVVIHIQQMKSVNDPPSHHIREQNTALHLVIILANEIYCRIEFFTAVYAVHVTCLPSAAINVN